MIPMGTPFQPTSTRADFASLPTTTSALDVISKLTGLIGNNMGRG
jgi:hypothetical protein